MKTSMTSPIPERRVATARRASVLGLVALVLCACSSSSDTDGLSAMDIARTLWRSTGGSSEVTLKDAAAIPYASIGYRVGDDPEQLLVLWNKLGPDTAWTSSSRVVLFLRNGRMVQSVGLKHNLSQLRFDVAASAALLPIAQGVPANYSWNIDIADMNVYGADVACRGLRMGPESITILGTNIATVRVKESCKCPALDWSFTNTYWVDPSNGRVWRTIQNISPKLDPVEIQILRPTE